ncbi:MAG: response regulator [Candidatus Latescibacterota bacterium]|jgi:CheY-like chemotaxis protein
MSDGKNKILIVDDDADQVAILAIELQSAGYEVVTAGGEEAAEELLMGIRPDLAIVDLMMENMDSGFVLSHRIKQLYPETPVIILTGVAAETRLDFDFAATGEQSWVKADAWIDKPVRSEQLRGEVTRLLKG